MRKGDLVRVHGGLLSTAPIALVLDHRAACRILRYEQLRVLWVNGPRTGEQNWEPAHTMERVIAK